MKPDRKTQPMTSLIDLEAYRARVADAVALAVAELIGSNRDNQKAVMQRMVAAYLLWSHDQLLTKDIARIMDKSEPWVRDAKDYIERRMSLYFAFKVYIDRTKASYALASS